jgi:hypothetical protein
MCLAFTVPAGRIKLNVNGPDEPRKSEQRPMFIRGKSPLLTIATWQLVCFAGFQIYPPTMGRFLIAAYTKLLGDVQGSFSAYARLAEYLELAVVTTIATAVSLKLLSVLSGPRSVQQYRAKTFLVWETAVLIVAACSFEFGFPYLINQADWTLFGEQSRIYSFRNLVLPRLVAWLIITSPVAGAALWLDRKMDSSNPRDRPLQTVAQ